MNSAPTPAPRVDPGQDTASSVVRAPVTVRSWVVVVLVGVPLLLIYVLVALASTSLYLIGLAMGSGAAPP